MNARASGENEEADVIHSLRRLGLAGPGETPQMVALEGGVSSDIWRVELAIGAVCVKRARARLKVEQVWEAPVERNGNEAEWMRVVADRVPGCTPKLIAEDRASGLFVMEYLEPGENRIWKDSLKTADADREFAARVGTILAQIHSATAGDDALAGRFGSNDMFFALRLEPYFLASARRNPHLADRLDDLANRTAQTKLALVHGDISPKNILVGPAGPVFLDAECAWYGDPAFDLAFCLCHLLLKAVWVPTAAPAFLACYRALSLAYEAGIDWEPAAAHRKRTATLLPALLLARVDGKSPVEYLGDARSKRSVRETAGVLLKHPEPDLEKIAAIWHREVVL
ncbi:MAG: phosphotransferase [Alphaproteobacteria bacterium]|nr:phosphotransferase [Alphaproteobacteria bacterium]